MKYTLVVGDDHVRFIKDVNARYKEGWKLYSSPFSSTEYDFVQAMVWDK